MISYDMGIKSHERHIQIRERRMCMNVHRQISVTLASYFIAFVEFGVAKATKSTNSKGNPHTHTHRTRHTERVKT